MPEWIPKRKGLHRAAVQHGITIKKKRETEFNLETHLAFLGYVEAFENVKRQTS
jgi:hypothetical protein